MTSPCVRWSELSDRQLVGDTLSTLELQFVKAHERDCVDCAREAQLLRDLRPGPLQAVPSEEEIQDILAGADFGPAVVERRFDVRRLLPSPGARWVALSGALALAASLVLVFGKGLESPGVNAHSPSENLAAAASAASTPMKDDSCGALADGLVVCLTAGSEIGPVGLSPSHRTIELKRGRAVVAVTSQPAGASFSVVTEAGTTTVSAAATLSVAVSDRDRATVRVTNGEASVRAKSSDAARVVAAGNALDMAGTVATPLSADDSKADLELLARFQRVVPK